jgi:LysM repeat protein
MRIFATLVAATLLLAGCSVNLDRSNKQATPGREHSSSATPTRLAPLRIVTPTPVTPGASPVGSQVPTPPAQNPATYVVQEADTLYAIALRFGVELQALIELNDLSDPNDIQVGQELKIPARQ